MDELKMKRYSELQKQLCNERDKIISDAVDSKLPNDCSVLQVKMKGTTTAVIIPRHNLYKEGYSLKRIEVDNRYIWDYIVNDIYMASPKVVNVSISDVYHEPFVFDKELYERLDELMDNKEYKELERELFDIK